MMKRDSITVEIETKLTVSEETIRKCLMLIDMWQEEHPDKYIMRTDMITDAGFKSIYDIAKR